MNNRDEKIKQFLKDIRKHIIDDLESNGLNVIKDNRLCNVLYTRNLAFEAKCNDAIDNLNIAIDLK